MTKHLQVKHKLIRISKCVNSFISDVFTRTNAVQNSSSSGDDSGKETGDRRSTPNARVMEDSGKDLKSSNGW